MFVYFIKTGDAIKVGIANDIDKRMINVQVGNPHKIELLHSLSLSEERARQTESEVHEIFHKTNLNGEWFQATQFMLDYINNIKENGWDSHLAWLERQYKEAYEEIVNTLQSKIERDIISGNLVSLDRLKSDLGKLLNEIFMIPSLPVNMAETVRKWIIKREEKPFVIRDVYLHFGVTTLNGKKNISKILNRLTREGILEKKGESPDCIYKKKL